MKKTPVLIIGALVVIVAIIALVAASGGKKDSTSMSDGMSKNTTQSSSSSNSTAAKDAVATNAVTISNYMFSPSAIKVKVGDTVTWANDDSVRHNVSGDNNELGTGKLIGKGETYTYTFKKAGTYTYHCDPHPYMKASVTVE